MTTNPRAPRRLAATLFACALAGVAPAAEPDGPPEGASGGEARTFERVWYRRPGRLFSLTGDLSIREDGLELLSRKTRVRIAFDAVRTVSFGKLKRDADTDWAVLEVGEPGSTRIVGFHDGDKFGYGERTREIFEAIRDALRRAGAAQYAVGAGHQAWEGLDGRFTLALRDGWSARADSVSYTPDGQVRAGHFVFSPAEGAAAAFFVEIAPAPAGATCREISEKGREALLALAAAYPLVEGGASGNEAPRVEPVTLGGCAGLRFRAHAAESLLDVRMTVHRDTLFSFGVRAAPDGAAASLEALDAAVSSLRFSVAR